MHAEARGEPYIGKVAVAAVILNRVKNPSFPNTIAGVIYQPGAFTAVADGQINLAPDEEALRAARDALNGWDPTYGAIYYYNPAKATSGWIWSRPVHIVIGRHRFARIGILQMNGRKVYGCQMVTSCSFSCSSCDCGFMGIQPISTEHGIPATILENLYQKSFYELVGQVGDIETKLSS